MGEEKKEEEKGGGGEEKKLEGEKKEEEIIVLKVDMHCEACARKVARSLRGFKGVEDVTVDYKASKVVVKGKTADPIKVCERIQKKSGRKVEIISPLPQPQEEPKKEPQPQEEKKEEPPAVITVVLKVGMHCDACAQALQKRIRKIQGVESVTTDVGNDQVMVRGTVDPTKLVSEVYKKTRKQASIVVEENKDDDKQEKDDDDDEKKKKKEAELADQEDKKKGGENKLEAEAVSTGENNDEENQKMMDIKKSEHWPSKYYMDHHIDHHAYPPQMFSDENPHACSVM